MEGASIHTCLLHYTQTKEIGKHTTEIGKRMKMTSDFVLCLQGWWKRIALELEVEKKAQAERDKMLKMQVLYSSFQLLVWNIE